jgi:hypothetical protein
MRLFIFIFTIAVRVIADWSTAVRLSFFKMFLKKSKWIKHIYLRLLYREGRRYKNSNIYILDGSAKSTEERALTKIAHLQLN